MGKRKVWQRLLAVVLALSMICSTQTMSVFADIVGYSIQNNAPAATPGETDPENVGGGDETSAFTPTETKVINQQGIITADTVNLREQPTTESNSLAALAKDTAVTAVNLLTIPGDDLKWYEVQTAEGTKGYVREDLMALTETEPQEQEEENEINLLNEGEDEENSNVVDTAAAVLEQAKKYFGEPNSNDDSGSNPMAGIGVTRTDNKGNSVKAGDELTFRLDWFLEVAPPYTYSGKEQTMFDTHDNAVISLTLPAGMTIVNASGLGITGSSETGKWEMKLDTPISATGGTVSGSLNFNVELDGNGSLPMNETFQASAGSLIDASITTHFTVKDKSNGGTDEWDYTKTYQSKDTISPITSASDDAWGIKKSNIALADNFTGDDEVTVQWKLEIGLKDGSGIATSVNSYTVNGRTGGTFSLTEDPVVLDREGKPVSPTSVTVRADFGSNQTYDFTTDKTQVITLDTCAGKEGLDDNLDSLTAPYYSTYTVTAVYPADAFIAGWNEENDDPLEVVNTATLIYSRSGETEKHQETANAKQDIGDETAPAALTIGKEVQFYGEDGAVKTYSSADTAWDWGDVEGDAVFKIEVKNADGTYAAAKLYTKNADGSYTEIADANGQVSINRATDDDGKVTVYVEPGDYKITEIDDPEHTTFEKVSGSGFTQVQGESAAEAALTADSTSEVTFTNTADYGRIVVTKKGTKAGADAPASDLAGAVFGLYTDEEAETTVTDDTGAAVTATVSNGTAVFNNVEAGTYYIKEITAPAHYTADNTIHEVTVTAGTENKELTVTNTYNGAYVKLQKMYQVYTQNEDGTGSWSYAALTDGTLRSQPKFTLQKKVDNGWEDVTGFTNATLDANGVWAPAATVPVYEEGEGGSVTGTLITYRFKETLPTGWEGDNQEGGFAYSAEFNLGQALLGKDTTNVATGGYIHKEIMNNRQTATITLTKIFRNMGNDGVQADQTADAGNNVATFQLYQKVGNGTITAVDGRTVSTNGQGQAVFTGLDVVGTGNQTISYYLGETDAKTGYALKLAGDAGIGTTVSEGKTLIGPISFENDADLSVAVTAYNVEQKIPVKIIKKDSENNTEVSGAEFSVKVTYTNETTEETKTVVSGAVMLLDATKGNITLEVTETKAPAGYERATDPIKETITIPEGGVGLSQDVVAVDFENDPYPSVTIAKTVEGKAVSTAVVFDVYTKDVQDNFVKATYPGYTDGLTLTSGDTLRLPAGEYWLHEQVPEGNPNKILDPDQFYTLYSEKYPASGTVKAVQKTIEGEAVTFFGPFEVKETDTTSVDWGSLDNISSVGGLTVTKQVYTGTENGTEQFAVKDGAEITISYTVTENGKPKTKTETKTTGTDGKATFSDLPVYNDDGSKISYTIEETKAPGNNKYDIAKETFETTLESGKTLTAEAKAGGKDLIFRNYPLRKLTVTKYVRDLWEYEFTGKQQLVQGAEIALYKLDENRENYTFVATKTTGNIGQVTFDNLGEGTYVAVEVSCPEIDGQTAVPAGGKELLSGKPESFAANTLDKYNYVKLEGREDVAGELINEIGWTQIKVEKVSSEDETKKLNGAIFELYKQVLTGNETEPLSFDPENPGSATLVTLVGTYSSGTLSDPLTGNVLDGEFATDILEADENVVYWLVETEAAPGYEIIPSEQIILFRYPGTNHKNSSNGGAATRVVEYSLNGKDNDPVVIKNEPGEGPGKERFAYVRLYKWAETETAGTYKPLGGVEYELHLSNKDGDILDFIDEMTTGLESDVKNPGSEGDSVLTGMAMSIRLNSLDYAEYADPETAGTEGDIAWYGTDGNLYVRMVLVETSAPFGYQADGQPHYLIVCFKTGESGEEALINYDETYFVFGDDTEETLASELKGYPEVGRGTSYRLTNKPLNNYSVTVRKYGYTPVDGAEGEYSTRNKTADELLTDVNSGLLKAVNLEVTMKLQHKNDKGEWVDFQYDVDGGFGEGTEQTFTTENGYFTFPNGLLEGEYRIIEKTAPAGYERLYNDEAHARYFKVERGSQEVVMFNPSKMSLTLQKTDLYGKAVSGVSFILNGTTKEVDNTSGKAVFENLSCLPATNYKLTEAVAEGTNLSDQYLEAYFEATYPNAEALVNGTGLKLGYDRSGSSEANPDVTITAIYTPEDYGLTGEIKVANPPLVSLTINKTDAENTEAKLDAGFEVYYQPFDSWTSHTVKAYGAEGASWTKVGSTYHTGEGGTVPVEDLKPGVYYVVETKAPDGYAKDANPQYVVLDGGMNVDVDTAAISGALIKADETGTSAAMTFEDTKLGSLTVTKTFDWGDLEEELQAGTYSFSFELYKENGTLVTTKTIDQTTANATITFEDLERGTYYLKENLDGSTEYKLGTVTKGTGEGALEIKAETSGTHAGRYKVEIAAGELDAAVTVENVYQYAQFTFSKVDGQDPSTKLPGAEFEVKKVTSGTGETDTVEKVEGAAVRDNGDGTYTAKVPLTEKGTYRVYETKAPNGDYLLDTDAYLEIADLNPGENRDVSNDEDGQLANEKGAFIEITKYNNMKEAENPAVLNGAEFTLYSRTKGTESEGWAIESGQVKTTGTDEDGKVRFVVDGTKEYAVAETKVPEGYRKLQGVYSGETALTSETITGTNTAVYVLGEAWELGKTYEFKAYNIPDDLKLVVRKTDISGSTVIPQARISVYEVSNELKEEDLTEQQVLELTKSSEAIAEDKWTDKPGSGFSYTEVTGIEPGKTYLVVENAVKALNANETYNTQMDNKEVEWFHLVSIPAGTDKKEFEVTLKNAQGDVSLNLTKSVKVVGSESSTLSSLFEKGQELEYTLTPTVTNDFALDSFILTDKGLTAYDSSGKELANALKDGYAITEVLVGAATYDAEDFDYTETPQVKATVEFIGFDGKTVVGTETVDVSKGGKTVSAPAEEGKEAASVVITYEDPGFKTHTENEYALGKNFTPGPVTLKVTLDKQEDGTDAVTIAKIVNTAGVDLKYRGWDGPHDHSAQATVPANAEAEIVFEENPIPEISVNKVVKGSETIKLEDSITYTLTLTNNSKDILDKDGNVKIHAAAFEQPALLDVLPKGTSVDTGSVKIVGDSHGLEISQSSVISFGSEEKGNSGQALLLYFSDEEGRNAKLEAGDSIQVEVTLKTAPGTAAYGNPIRNLAFASSRKPGVVTGENPVGASFKGSNGWGEAISEFNGEEILGSRASALEAALSGEGLYGFIHSAEDVTWDTSSTLTLSKANYGSEDDPVYRTDRVARTASKGFVNYQLTVTNTDPQAYRSDLTVMDAMPRVGDVTGTAGASRESQWPLYFAGEASLSVTVGGTELSSDKYDVYYYTEKVEAGTYNAVKTLDGCPAGWSPDAPADLKTVTAIIVDVDPSVYLAPNATMTVEYKTDVDDYDQIDLAEIGYTNAVNNFVFYYSDCFDYAVADDGTVTLNKKNSAKVQLTSATVSATIIPAKVKVGGHVWIDADHKGTWDKNGSENMSDFMDYQIVQDLLSDISITLLKYTYKDDTITGREPADKTGSEWTDDANFVFDSLDPAVPLGEAALYENNQLNVGDLKGDNPATYQITATLSEALSKVFELTTWGGTYESVDPKVVNTKDPDAYDSNFNGDASSSNTERFYLWQVPVDTAWDNTKDIGFTPYRTLTIQKQAADDAGTKVAGAEFEVYGPFEEGTAANANLTGLEPVAEGKTETDGRLAFSEKLLWFKEYVIVEKTAAEGYSLDGATAAEDPSGKVNVTQIGDSAKWVLGIPGTNAGVNDANQTVTIKNERKATTQFSVTKKLTGREATESDTFTFELVKSPDAEDVLDSVTMTGNGTATFDAITLKTLGDHVYYIRENGTNPVSGIAYDQKVYQVKVTTAWEQVEGADEEEHWQMTVTNPVYRLCDEEGKPTGAELTSITFTNEYEATGPWTLEGTKTLTGRNHKDGETFSFRLEAADANGTVLTGEDAYSDESINYTVDSDGTGSFAFDTIEYAKNGTVDQTGDHYYLITETGHETASNGLAANSQQFLVKVNVTDNGDGSLTATMTEVKERSGADGTWAEVADKAVEFENTYTSSGSDTLNGSKTVTGGPLRNFSFGIYTDEACTQKADSERVGTNPAAITASQAVSGTFTFGQIHFTQEDIDKATGTGTVILYVKEEGADKDDDTTNDTTLYRVTYSLTDDGEGGITPTRTIEKKAEGEDNWSAVAETVNGVTFNNNYEADGHVNLKARKELTGKDFKAAEFTFKLLAADGTTVLDTKNAAADGEPVAGKNNTYSAEVAFDQIDYDMEDLAIKDDNSNVTGYEDEKTFTYYIVEEAGSATGMDYSEARYKVEVTVADDGTGTLATSSKITQELNDEGGTTTNVVEEATFTNHYTTSGSATLTATKNLQGQELSDGQFTFTLKDVTDPKAENPLTQTVTNNGAGSVTFELNNVYDQDDAGKTFTYEISEQPGPANMGYTYSGAVYRAEVKVSLNADETGLDTTVQYYKKQGNSWGAVSAGEVKFDNSYKASGSTTINGTKEVTYRKAAVELDEFTFLLKEGSTEIARIKTQADGDFSYTFNYAITEKTTDEELAALLGEHTYTLTEVPGSDDEIGYSAQEYTIKIMVTDKKDGNLEATVTSVTEKTAGTVNADAITFANTYKADGKAVLNITKKLAGNRAEGIGKNEFGFTAVEVDTNGAEVAGGQKGTSQMSEAGTDDKYTAAGTITLSYDQTDLKEDGGAKTYWYKVTEDDIKSTSVSVTKDDPDALYYAKVVVSDGGSHSILTEVTYHEAIGDDEPVVADEETGVTFTNNYTAEGEGKISGNKELTGNRKDPIAANEFKFEVVNTTSKEVVGTAALTGGSYSEGFTIIFDKDVVNGNVVKFTQADIGQTFTNYVLREAIPAEGEAGYKASIDYDETTYPLTVTVADSTTEKGKLTITVTRADGKTDTPQFTNKYLATGTGSISGTKKLTGNRLNTGAVKPSEFTFQVLDGNNKVVGTAVNDGQGNFTIADIYKTVSEDAEGNAVNVPFDQDDIREEAYTGYTLVEVDKADTETTGITYDKTKYPLTITVSDKDGQGSLDVKVELDGEAEAAEFTNDYHAAGTGEIDLTKSLTGRPTGLSAGEFKFKIYELVDTDDDGVADKRVQLMVDAANPLIASNDAAGNIHFELSYDETDQGTHTYVIKEIDTEDPNITYDDTEIQVSVNVVDDGDGTMTATTTYPEDDTTFYNSYTATGSVTFTGWKYVLGNRAAQVTEDEFTFTVMEKMADGTEVEVATGRTLDGGRIEFTQIDYDQDDRNDPDDPDDVHTYLIYEDVYGEDDPRKDDSIAYETEPVTVTVKVTDAVTPADPETGETEYLEGYLDTVVTYPQNEDGTYGVKFENQYLAEGSIDLTGTKELLGNRAADLEDGEFTFEVRELDENGVPGQTVVTTGESKADGTIDFEPIEYKVEAGRSDIGTHTYEIREVAGTDETVDYTDTVFTVTVEVTDLGEGKLDAQVVQEESQTVAFQNQYLAAGELTLDNFSKALDGSALTEGQFTFQLTDEAGNVLQTVTNGADGSIAFEPLTYDQDDIGQEFVYTVSEVNTGVNGITYDETAYTVRVTVEDSETSDGNLVVTPTVLNGSSVVEPAEGELLPAVTFENAFDGSVTLTKQGADGRNLAGAQFTLYAATGQEDAYEIYAAAENPQGIYTTDENGQLTVTGLPANTYYFVETQAPAGYAIETDANGDPVKYEFTIGVEDGTTAAVVNAALTVIDPLATTGSIQVTKRVSTWNVDFEQIDFIANNETYYVGIFTDAAGTQPYGTDYIRSIYMDGVSVSEPVTFDGLTSGTYYILETDAEGNPIPMGEPQTMNGASFSCQTEEESSNMVTLDLTADDRPGLVRLQNVYTELPPEGYSWEASLNITKRVLRNGEEATVDDTFYAGVFYQLEDGSYELLVEVELLQNDTVTVSGLGGPVGGSMTYYVFETDGNGNPVSDDPAFGYSVDGEGSVTVTEQNTTGAVTITNSFEEEETTTTTTTTTTTSGSGTATGKSTANVKTGDDTNLMPYLAMMVLAAAAAAGVLVYRKRRREDEEEI